MGTRESLEARIAEYLAEVEAHLQEAGPEERRETLRGIEEHLWEALRARAGGEPTMPDLEAVLAEASPPSSYGSARARRFPYRRVGWAAVASLGAAIVFPAAVLLGAGLFGWKVTTAAAVLLVGAPFALAAVVLGIISWREPQGKAAVVGALLLALAASFVVPVTRRQTGGSADPVESVEVRP